MIAGEGNVRKLPHGFEIQISLPYSGWTNVFVFLEGVFVVIDPHFCLHVDNAHMHCFALRLLCFHRTYRRV